MAHTIHICLMQRQNTLGSCRYCSLCTCNRKDGGRCEIYLKREDLNHTGAHKINNSLGQALLCLRMGKKRIIAETGAGQHGVATATVCARFGLQCIIYMGSKVRCARVGANKACWPGCGCLHCTSIAAGAWRWMQTRHLQLAQVRDSLEHCCCCCCTPLHLS